MPKRQKAATCHIWKLLNPMPMAQDLAYLKFERLDSMLWRWVFWHLYQILTLQPCYSLWGVLSYSYIEESSKGLQCGNLTNSLTAMHVFNMIEYLCIQSNFRMIYWMKDIINSPPTCPPWNSSLILLIAANQSHQCQKISLS